MLNRYVSVSPTLGRLGYAQHSWIWKSITLEQFNLSIKILHLAACALECDERIVL